MAEKEWDPTVMDNAASDAENDLLEVDNKALEVVADWWKKWYNRTPDGKPGAGHKRLGRILLQYSTNGNSKITLNSKTGKFEQAAGE